MDDQNPNTTNKPLLQENPYPFVEEEPALKPYQYNSPQSTNNVNQVVQPQVNQVVQPQVISQPIQNYPPQNYNVNQNYQPNQNYPPQNYQPQPQNYNPNQNFQPQPNQGFQPNQAQKAYQPPPYPYPVQNQGFMPAPPGQFQPVPPPPIGQPAVVSLPGAITPVHPKYAYIVQQCNMPCPVCQFRGSDYVSLTPGCAAISWSVCLCLLTGVLCFWIPLVVDGCKDIVIRCSRCRSVKAKVEKSCC